MIAWSAFLVNTIGNVPMAQAGYIDHFAARDDIGPDKAPHLGVSRILVLPLIVDESDLPSERNLLNEASTFYDDNRSGFGFTDYYRRASLGRFSAIVEVAPVQHVATCPFSRNLAGHCTIPRGDIQSLGPALRALRDILDQADAVVDFSRYDSNGINPGTADGYIDGLILLTNIDFGGIALPFMRLCQFALLAGAYCKQPPFIGDLWDQTYDGVVVPWAAVSGCSGGDCHFATHVSVHEFGHLLGFADLYDESGASTDLPYAYMGGWDYGDQPPVPSAISRYLIGWAQPRQASGDGNYRIGAAASHGDLLKLGSGQQYFLAEFRRGLDYLDGDINSAGVAIYHVDLAQRPGPEVNSYLQTIASCVNCDTWSPMVMLEQADGQFELQQGAGRRDDAGDLFRVGDALPAAADDSLALSANHHPFNSNRYDGSSTGIEVEVLRIDADGALLRVTHPTLGDACADVLCPAGQTCEAGTCAVSGFDAGAHSDSGTGQDHLGSDAEQRDAGPFDRMRLPDTPAGVDSLSPSDLSSGIESGADEAVFSETGLTSAQGDSGGNSAVEGGCGCRSQKSVATWMLWSLGLLVFARRRRSRQPRFWAGAGRQRVAS